MKRRQFSSDFCSDRAKIPDDRVVEPFQVPIAHVGHFEIRRFVGACL